MRTAKTAGVLMSLVFTASMAAQPPAAPEPRAETQGIKETDKFIKQGGEVAHAVGVAKLQVQNTLASYNALVSSSSKNMKKDYGKLLKEMKEMDEKTAAARTEVGEMETAGKTYFAGRETTIAGIKDPQLKATAQQRLAASQKQHADVLASLRSTGEALEPIRKELDDQIKFLGSDLNPGAAAALAPNAKKLNDQGNTAFAKADEAINNANTYFNALKSETGR